MLNRIRALPVRQAPIRTRRGATMALVIAAGAILALVGVACLTIQMTANTSMSLQRAVDSGALTVSRDTLKKVHVPLRQNSEQMQFADLAPADPNEREIKPYDGSGSATNAGGSGGSHGASSSSAANAGPSGNANQSRRGTTDYNDNNQTRRDRESSNRSGTGSGASQSDGGRAGKNGSAGNSSNHSTHSLGGPTSGGTGQNGQSSDSGGNGGGTAWGGSGSQAGLIDPNPADGDKTTSVSLQNINKIIGKALMIGMNGEAMDNQSVGTFESHEHCTKILVAVNDINKRLKSGLSQESKLKAIFLQTAKANTIRTLHEAEAQLTPVGGSWQTNYADVGLPSDVQLKTAQIPDGYDPSLLSTTDNKDGSKQLNGYVPDRVMSIPLEFVPLTPNKQPHLISKSTFFTKAKGGDHRDIPPNAFCMSGSVITEGMTLNSTAAAQTEPAKGSTPIELKHGFIRIRIRPNLQYYILDGKVKGRGWYNQNPTLLATYDDVQTVMTESQIGQELGSANPTIKDLLFPPTASTGAGYDKLKHALQQRLCEIDSNFGNEGSLNTLLSSKEVPLFPDPPSDLRLKRGTTWINYKNYYKNVPQELVFYILKPDNAQLMVLQENEVLGRAPWMSSYMSTQPDGVKVSVVEASLGNGGDRTKYKDPAVKGAGYSVGHSQSMTWSTGYDNMLLEISAGRVTRIEVRVTK